MKKILLLLLLITSSCHLSAQDKKMKITIGNNEFTATLNNNVTVDAFIRLLPLTIDMTEMGGYEKFNYLPESLPGTATNVGTTYEGDLMIWSSNCLVLFYVTRSTSYSYIRLGRIDNIQGLREAIGSGNIQVKFELENNTKNEAINIDKDEYKILMADNYIQVEGEFEKITLANLNGMTISQSNDKIIKTDHLPIGYYILKIESSKNGVTTKKVLKR